MLLLAGLGNPGTKYAKNRHNIGFLTVDAIADRHHFGPEKKRFQALTREGSLEGIKCLTLKPQTFMNESGRSIGEAMRFFKAAPADVVIFYDELDLPPGKLRMKTGGGAAGHNGIRSTIAHIGPEFRRARLGIGHPGDKSQVHRYVLGDFAKRDGDWLGPLLAAVSDAANLLAKGDDATFMNKVHLAQNAG